MWIMETLEEIHIDFIRRATKVELVRSKVPRMCDFSGKNLFWKYAYRVSAEYPSHYGLSSYEGDKWYEVDQFMVLKLRA